MKKAAFFAMLLWLLCTSTCQADGADGRGSVPHDFPSMTVHVYDANALADGYIFLAVATEVEGVGYYLMVLDNDGVPYAYKELPDDYAYDFKVQPNGLLSYAQFIHHHSFIGGGHCIWVLLDHNLDIVEEIQMGNGYIAEAHDFQLLPNGQALLFGYYMSQVDMSRIVQGGHPAAQVSGGVVQELDADRNVIFQWRSWDHYDFADQSYTRATNKTVSAFHLNTIEMDTDGTFFLATPSWVKKIDRQTGQIVYHLGGNENEFSLVGDGADVSHFGGHAFHRIANGNVLIYKNGNRQGTTSSSVHEYRLDEENRIAEYVWSFVPQTPIPAWHRGNAQRLPNGNTFIGWGGASGKPIPTCSEVTAEGRIVFELYFDNPEVESYRAFRLPFPGHVQGTEVTEYELATGNTYVFADDRGDTGVTIKVIDRTGDGYNQATVARVPFAPLYPAFPGKAPRLLPMRFTVSQHGILSISAEIAFDAAGLDFAEPEALTVYYRRYPDSGLFLPLETTYNPATQRVRAFANGVGEFALGYPDVTDVPFAPLLHEPQSLQVMDFMANHPESLRTDRDYTVNQTLPVSLVWSPVGFARFYHLQVSRDPDFAVLDVDDDSLVEARYVLETVEPDTVYYWRVNTYNYGGVGEWACGSFTTVEPAIRLVSPNGGETLHRGLEYFIRWTDNLDEDVEIELYKDHMLVQSIGVAPSDGAYAWEVGLNLEPGDDYTIRIKSAVEGPLADTSNGTFAVE
jgi:hypothetical protein